MADSANAQVPCGNWRFSRAMPAAGDSIRPSYWAHVFRVELNWLPVVASNHLSARNVPITRENFAPSAPYNPLNQDIDWSTDCQLDRLAGTAEHLHQRIDGEFGRFLIHDVGHTRPRDHQYLGGLGLL